MARTRWPPICEPRPLAQARQIGPAAPVGARNGTRPTGRSQDNPYGLRPIAGQTGSQPDLTPAATQNHGSRAEALSTSSLPIGLALGAPPPARAATSSGTNYRNPDKSSGWAPPAARPRRSAAVKPGASAGRRGLLVAWPTVPGPGDAGTVAAGTRVACGARPGGADGQTPHVWPPVPARACLGGSAPSGGAAARSTLRAQPGTRGMPPGPATACRHPGAGAP